MFIYLYILVYIVNNVHNVYVDIHILNFIKSNLKVLTIVTL